MRISIDECKERTARLHAKKDSFIKACSSRFLENNDEDLKVIDASPIRSMFCNMNFDDYGTDDEPTFPRRRHKNSESSDLNAKFGKREIGESSTSNNIEPTISDFKEFDYDNCSLEGWISLLQSVVDSPHAYSQNKAFTKLIVDALMQSYDEKLNLVVSIPRKLNDEWEPTIKIRIKDFECFTLCDLGC